MPAVEPCTMSDGGFLRSDQVIWSFAEKWTSVCIPYFVEMVNELLNAAFAQCRIRHLRSAMCVGHFLVEVEINCEICSIPCSYKC